MEQMPSIKIMGIGHSGNHALDYVMNQSVRNVEYIAVADEETLLRSGAEHSILLDAEVIKCFYLDENLSVNKIKPWITVKLDRVLADADVLFIIAGMGGQVGTDVAPIVAQRAKELGIVTMALVTKPFPFEGSQRMQKAADGIERLKEYVDAMLIVSNDKLLPLMDKKMELKDGFQKINQYFYQEIKERCKVLTEPKNWSLDADGMRKVLQDQGVLFENFFLRN